MLPRQFLSDAVCDIRVGLMCRLDVLFRPWLQQLEHVNRQGNLLGSCY